MGKARASASTVRSKLDELRRATGWSKSDLVSVLRGGGSSSKGSEWERLFCQVLGMWWCGRDDVFWRTGGSGGRAKTRGRAGAATYGQHGDVAATDPTGAPLIDTFTIELKRGYNEHTIHDIVDRKADAAIQEHEAFFAQTIESAEQAGTMGWLCVTSRVRREAMVWMPHAALEALRRAGAFAVRPVPSISFQEEIRNHGIQRIHGTTLESFWNGVSPDHILSIASSLK